MGYGAEMLAAGKNFIFLFEFFFFLFVAKWVYERSTNFSVQHELTKKDNLALSITLIGYLLGVSIVLIGVHMGEAIDSELPYLLFVQLTDIAMYSILSIVLLLLARIINDRFILHNFSVYKEIIEDKNSGTGVVLFASFVSAALVVNAALTGEDTGIISCIFFFAVGQAILILFAKLYQFITPFDLHDEIEKDNIAVGCSFAGTLLAIGILVSKGITGEFDGLADLLLNLSLYTLAGFILFPVIRIGFDRFFIPGVDLSTELVEDRNIGLGALEGTLAIIAASAIYFAV